MSKGRKVLTVIYGVKKDFIVAECSRFDMD
jgi:hypothetical protein